MAVYYPTKIIHLYVETHFLFFRGRLMTLKWLCWFCRHIVAATYFAYGDTWMRRE